jgi:gluconolactonase
LFITDNLSHASFIIPLKGFDDQFVISSTKKLLVIEWDGRSPKAKVIRTVGEVDKGPVDTVFNDGKADPRGRLFSGTMRKIVDGDLYKEPLGTFYRYSKENHGFVALKSKIGISNGLAWNTATNKFYYVDSLAFDVKEFDYDPITGDICKLLENSLDHFQNFLKFQPTNESSSTFDLTDKVQPLSQTA